MDIDFPIAFDLRDIKRLQDNPIFRDEMNTSRKNVASIHFNIPFPVDSTLFNHFPWILILYNFYRPDP